MEGWMEEGRGCNYLQKFDILSKSTEPSDMAN